MNKQGLLAELREAYWAKRIAEDNYNEVLAAYKATDPAPGSVEVDDIKITRTKDTTRKSFNQKKFKAVYGVTEYERFVDEKPQEGSVRVTVLKPTDDEEDMF